MNIITLRNGNTLRAAEEICFDKGLGSIRYLGEDGKYYLPYDIVSISPFDKDKSAIERDCIYQLRKDKEILERKIESMILSFSEKYGGLHIETCIKEFETTDVNTNKKSPMFKVSFKISI